VPTIEEQTAISIIENSSDIDAIRGALEILQYAPPVTINLIDPETMSTMARRLAEVGNGTLVKVADDGIYVFYSGLIGDRPAWKIAENLGEGYKTIGQTELGKLFNSQAFLNINNSMLSHYGSTYTRLIHTFLNNKKRKVS
jgi:hypothetical protein